MSDASVPPSSAEESLADLSVRRFLARTAERTPVPGGGAVAATTLALAAALGQMVLAYTIGKRRFAEHDAENRARAQRLADDVEGFLALADADARGYARLSEVSRLPLEDPRRAVELAAAIDGAMAPPLEMLRRAAALCEGLAGLGAVTAPALASDLAIAAGLAEAGARAAAWNVRANLPLLRESATNGVERAAALESEMAAALATGRAALAEFEGPTPA